MTNYVCATCGTQYADTAWAPEHCLICEDERQYVNPNGQAWTTLDKLRTENHNVIEPVEPGLFRLKSEPKVGIGQYAFLVQTPQGNVLWDCLTLIDDATCEAIEKLGGLAAIAISHPHFHSSLVEWSRAFRDIPVYIHAKNREWAMRPDPSIVFWEGPTHPLMDVVTLICCGGRSCGCLGLRRSDGGRSRGPVLFVVTTLFVAGESSCDERY